MRVLNRKQKILTLSLMAVFSSAAFAENHSQTAGRVALSDDNHAQMAAENVRKINGIESSGSLKMPTDLQVTGYQPEINQSYDLKNNSQFLLPASNQIQNNNWQIDESYSLENNHFSGSLKNVFQQDNESVLLAENTVTETATDAQSPAQEVLSGSTNNDETPVVETTNTANATELPSITVKGERKIKPTERYQHTINRTQIEHSASGNGDIGSMLRSLPNVQFDNAQRSSKTPGEIDPADISISGGQHYQNLFLLDGLNINNNLDPNGGSTTSGSEHWGLPQGRSQGVNINVDLLESITVKDSNIGAEYGGFGGGVIEATTKRPEKDFSFSLSHQYTSGNIDKHFPHSLTKYNIDEEEKEAFRNSSKKDNQPEFYKHITKMSVGGIINDQLSLIGQLNRTYSKIPIRSFTDTYKNYSNPIDPPNMDSIKQNQKRYSYNAFIKAYYNPSPDLGFELSYAYMPDWSREFLQSTYGKFYDVEHGGHLFSAKTKWNNDWGKLTNTFGVSLLSDKITPDGYKDFKVWVPSENNAHLGSDGEGWVFDGGSIGRVSNQKTWSNKLVQEFKPFELANTEHTIKTGAEIKLIKADFKYKDEHWDTRNTWTKPMTREQQEKCIAGNDYSWCDPSTAYDVYGNQKKNINGDNIIEHFYQDKYGNDKSIIQWPYGQWRDSLGHYRGDKISVKDNQFGVFLEDSIKLPTKYGEWTAIPGVRVDYNSFMKKTDFAPRFTLDYGFAWNESNPDKATHLTYGWNRYYNSNMYAYALNDGWRSFRTDVYRSDIDTSFEEVMAKGRECENSKDKDNCIVKYKSSTVFNKLKTPYTDEQMFGFSQDFADWNLTAKYIHRNGRDEVVRTTANRLPDFRLPNESYYASDAYVYTNRGKSKSDIVSLTLGTKKPLEVLGVKNTFKLGFDWTQVKRSYANYNSNLDASELDDDFVMWDGELIRKSQRPADNFLKPYSIKLSTDHSWKMLGGDWHWNNLISFRQGYNARSQKYNVVNGRYVAATVNGADYGVNQDKINVYEITKLPSGYTWDMRLGAEYDVYKKNKLFFNIDVMNVTNKKNVALATVARTGDVTPTYETGRQFWFELGYKF